MSSPSKQLHISYEFWFTNDDSKVTVTFMGPPEWKYSGADHTFPHQQRRQWALSLINAHPNSWRALPLSEYIETLEERGFLYDEFLIQKFNHPKEFQILCRSVSHL